MIYVYNLANEKFLEHLQSLPLLVYSFLILSACNNSSPVATSTSAVVQTPEITPGSPEPSQTPLPPSPTPVPLAAIINGQEITLEEYQGELARYQAVTPITGTNSGI